MTKEQAVKIAQSFWGGSASSAVDTLVELGMLKLDEPKSARDKFIEQMKVQNYSEGSMGMRDALKAFDAVEK